MKKKIMALLSLGTTLTFVLCPMAALAQQSPEFAYSAEKWASLRDDVLEFDEIPDLIHEYNNTVLQNYMTYRQDYIDKTADDIAQDYYDAADEVYANLTYPDSDSENYGSGLSSYLSNRQQAEQLVERGDKNADDQITVKLSNDQTEANLAKQAQESMISYYSQLYSLDTLEQNIVKAENSLASEQTKLAAGTSTNAAVLSAEQAVTQAQASYQSAVSSLQSTKENLLLMLGWSYGADVVIGELPDPDLAVIAAINPDADIEAAKENNYSLQITIRQLDNARSASVTETLTQTRANAEQAIANNVSGLYKSLELAVSDYEQAQQAFALQQSELASAQRKLSAGTITRNSYSTTETAYLQAEVSVRTAKLSLLTALTDYEWAVNGLASTS